MFSRITSATLHGINALIVKVEVDLARGLPGWQIVGLPETMIKESKERVNAAIRNSGFELASRKTTINLVPADQKKGGTAFDLPIAMGLLAATGMYPHTRTNGYLVAGELSLTGALEPIHGVISFATASRTRGLKGLIIPQQNTNEASLVPDLDIIGARNLSEVVNFLKDGVRPPQVTYSSPKTISYTDDMDFGDIKGQVFAKRALEIAAAGGHHVLMVGPPGTGKTMLAERLRTILPPMDYEEALETTRLHSIFGLISDSDPLVRARPFRAPHHSASYVGLVGGGSGIPKPGEISIAHNGVLFLDELTEFRKDVIEVLRQPLESGRVHIIRSGVSITYPARFMLVAAMNPCRCGYLGHPTRACICSVGSIQLYRRKVSGPMLDRIDIHVSVPPLSVTELMGGNHSEGSAAIRARVLAARERQHRRYNGKIAYNSLLSHRETKEFCTLGPREESFLKQLIEKIGVSARAYDKILKVSRTIADLEGSDNISASHLSEAAQYRELDREVF